jgi:hypothetical protein
MEVWETRAVYTAKTAVTAAAVVGRELFVGSDDGSARIIQLTGARASARARWQEAQRWLS